MSAAVLGEEPKHPEFQLRETTWIMLVKIGVVWLMTFLALGIGAHAILTETAEVPHYIALGFGAIFFLVALSPWPYRRTLLVAVDAGFLYVMTRDLRSCACLPLSRLRLAEVKKLSNHQGAPSWYLLLDVGLDANDEGLDTRHSETPGVIHIANGGHGRASLEACARQLSALKDAAGK